MQGGADFPTIWRTLLKSHDLVVGAPVQGVDVDPPVLEIRLIDGRRLQFDHDVFVLD